MKSIFGKFRLLSLLLFLLTAVAANGQNSADKLFNEGKALQAKKQWKLAKAKFNSAKTIYLAAKNTERAKTCDIEIANCQPRKSTPTPTQTPTQTPTPTPTPSTPVHTDVVLSLSEDRLDFDCNPKNGATQSVEVNCNYDDWKADTDKEWITIYTTEKKFTVEVAENTSEEERAAVIKVTCGDKSVDLVVNQSKATQLRKIKDAVGGLFKKKKKK